MKQTAVKWLIDQLVNENEVVLKGENYKLFEQALAMEREQIIQAFKEGLKSPYHRDYTIVTQEGQEETKSGQYYNETYGGDK